MQSFTPPTGYTIHSITYTVRSARVPSMTYTVSVDPVDQRMTCTCPARRQCWHQKAVIAGIAGKPTVRLQPRRPATRTTVDELFSDGGDALDAALSTRRAVA